MVGSKKARLLVAALAAALVVCGALVASAGGTSPTNDGAARASAGVKSDGTEFSPLGHHHHAKIHYLSYSAAAFAPDHIATPANDYFNRWDPTNLTDTDNRCFGTSVLLPDGAQVIAVRFFYQQTVTKEFYGELNRQQLGTNHSTGLVTVSPSDTSGKIKFISKGVKKHLRKVNNLKYAYALGVCPPNSSGVSHGAFRGAQVAYSG